MQNILQLKESQPNTAVSYFYFDFNDIEKQSSRRAIRSLLFQFALQQPDDLRNLEKLCQKYGNGQQQPAEDVTRSSLRDAVTRMGQKYIILDALDECTYREDLLTFILELINPQPRDLRVMATSRREKDIEEQLSSIAHCNINIQSALVDEDIRVYIRNRLSTDTKLKKWPQSVQNEIIAVMMEKAGGMYVSRLAHKV